MYNSDFHGYVKDLEQRQIKQKKKKGQFSPLLNEIINFNKYVLRIIHIGLPKNVFNGMFSFLSKFVLLFI